MSSKLLTRIAEGIVVGISASAMIAVYTAMTSAKDELTLARETLDIQVEVNQGMLDNYEDLEQRLEDLQERMRRVEDREPIYSYPETGSVPDFLSQRLAPEEFDLDPPTPASTAEPQTLPSVSLPTPNVLQQRIDEQRAMRQ